MSPCLLGHLPPTACLGPQVFKFKDSSAGGLIKADVRVG